MVAKKLFAWISISCKIQLFTHIQFCLCVVKNQCIGWFMNMSIGNYLLVFIFLHYVQMRKDSKLKFIMEEALSQVHISNHLPHCLNFLKYKVSSSNRSELQTTTNRFRQLTRNFYRQSAKFGKDTQLLH